MRYWDNDFDRKFDEALDEMTRALHKPYTDEDIEDMYQQHLQRTNISNPVALIGAQ